MMLAQKLFCKIFRTKTNIFSNLIDFHNQYKSFLKKCNNILNVVIQEMYKVTEIM